MPIDVSPGKTPKGRDIMLLHAHGVVDKADGDMFEHGFQPGGQLRGKSLLSVVDDGVTYTPEGRRGFTKVGENMGDTPSAIVIKSAALRIMINFMAKANNVVRKKPLNTRTFATREEALAWLDVELEKLEQRGSQAAG